MTVDEIVRQAAIMCGFELDAGSDGKLDSRYKRLETSVLYATMEAAKSLRIKRTEIINVDDYSIPYDKLEYDLVEAISIKKNGKILAWNEDDSKINLCENGTVEIKYIAYQKVLKSCDEPLISEIIFPHINYSYYAASEFLSADGRHTDALSFNIKWENALYSYRKKTLVPFRRWI